MGRQLVKILILLDTRCPLSGWRLSKEHAVLRGHFQGKVIRIPKNTNPISEIEWNKGRCE